MRGSLNLSAGGCAGELLVTIVKQEGVGALYKGALPRALWVAPVGAMNFAGVLHIFEPPLN